MKGVEGALKQTHQSTVTVELKNGQRVEGVLKQADQSTVTVEVGGQTLTFKADQVSAIRYGTAAVATPVGSPTTEAVRALTDLQSVVSSNVSYRDYGPRVADANIVVRRFLETPASGDEDVRTWIQEAIGFYLLAGRVWSEKVKGEQVMLLQDQPDLALAKKCDLPKLLNIDPNVLTAAGQAKWKDPVPTLWGCASERIATAAKAIGAGW